MKKINIIAHFPEDSLSKNGIQEAVNQSYLRFVEIILNQSQLSKSEKEQLLNQLIKTYQKESNNS